MKGVLVVKKILLCYLVFGTLQGHAQTQPPPQPSPTATPAVGLQPEISETTPEGMVTRTEGGKTILVLGPGHEMELPNPSVIFNLSKYPNYRTNIDQARALNKENAIKYLQAYTDIYFRNSSTVNHTPFNEFLDVTLRRIDQAPLAPLIDITNPPLRFKAALDKIVFAIESEKLRRINQAKQIDKTATDIEALKKEVASLDQKIGSLQANSGETEYASPLITLILAGAGFLLGLVAIFMVMRNN